MALIPNVHRPATLSFYEGSTYTPDTIGSFVSVEKRDAPWNTIGSALKGSKGTGVTADHLLTAREALELAGIDIQVKKIQATDPETKKPIPKLFATCYDDPESGERYYFGGVKDTYHVVQPSEALSFFDQVILNKHGAHYSAAWSMREKAQLGVTIEFPDSIVVDPGGSADVVGLYGLGFSSFDGSTGLGLAATAIRFWCMNQLPPVIRLSGINAQRSVSFKHTSGVMTRVEEARKAIGVAYNWAEAFDAIATRMIATRVTDRQFVNLIKNLAPFKLDGSETPVQERRVQERRDMVLAQWAAPHNANIAGTRWGAYNVVAEYADWGRRVIGSRRNDTTPERQRAIGGLVHPSVFQWKQQMFDLCAN